MNTKFVKRSFFALSTSLAILAFAATASAQYLRTQGVGFYAPHVPDASLLQGPETGAIVLSGTLGAASFKGFDGSDWVDLSPATPAAPIRKVYKSSGTYTPTSGTRYIVVEMVGAGGGGAGSADNANNATDGTTGQATSFGSILVANGGTGGEHNAGVIAAGGTCSLNPTYAEEIVQLQGGSGGGSGAAGNGITVSGGIGGTSALGGAGSTGAAAHIGGNCVEQNLMI